MDNSKPTLPAVDSLSFEQAMDELRSLVDQMERGDAKLDQALAAFERGAALRKRCQSLLEQAKLKIEQVTKDENGNFTFEALQGE